MYRVALVLLMVGAVACGQGDEPLALEDGCQPLMGGVDCLSPYPSDFFRTPDSSTPSGFRVRTTGAARMITDLDVEADIHEWRPIDGASRIPLIVAFLPHEIRQDGFVGLTDDADRSISADSQTLIIEADTGALIPHFVDLDPDYYYAEEQAIVLHPLVKLAENTRYVVVIRGVLGPDDAPVGAPEGFARLRDKRSIDDPDLVDHVDHFDTNVFPVAEAAGVDRADLQLAWDFTTRTDANAMSDMLRDRDLTLAWLETETIEVTIDEVIDHADGVIARTIHGTLVGPSFVAEDEPGSEFVRTSDDQVQIVGTVEFPFVAQVPRSVLDATAPVRALAFGHGFFGERTESEGGAVQGIASDLAAVTFAIDWAGMSMRDQSFVSYAVAAEPTIALSFTDRAHQGMANWLVTTAAIRTVLADEVSLQTGAGAPFYDTSTVHFLGISMGHFLGGVMVGLNPDIAQACFNVGGAGIVHIMARSLPFSLFVQIMRGPFPDSIDRYRFMATTAATFDRIDGMTYTEHLMSDDRRVLLQAGVGDASVPNLATFMHARELAVPVMSPSPLPVYGMTEATSPHDGSALALFDWGVDPDLYAPAYPPPDNDVHEEVRRSPAAIEQMDMFFRNDSAVLNPCDGACDPN
jgi:hypothetical protein